MSATGRRGALIHVNPEMQEPASCSCESWKERAMTVPAEGVGSTAPTSQTEMADAARSGPDIYG
jgi:hypothetical protein